MIGVIGILKDDATVSSLVGTRVYPLERPQGSDLPAITVDVDESEPSDTKDGVSTLDTNFITVTIYGDSYSTSLLTLESAVRSALDRTSGTYSTEQIDSIQYLGRFTFYERVANDTLHFIEHNYKVRVIQ